MEIVSSCIVYIFFFLIMAALFSCYLPQKQQRKLKLPPGSMGWPYIGETLSLYSQDPTLFFSNKQKRYGDIFKTHILGCPCVMVATPEAVRFVLVTHSHLFRPAYPKSKQQLLGPSALFFHHGTYHSQLRKLVQRSLSTQVVLQLVPRIQTLVVSSLESWSKKHILNTFQEMKEFSFEVGILAIFGNLEKKYREGLMENYCIVDKGYNSFPTNLPAYNKAIMARKRLNQILSEIMCEWKEKSMLGKNLLGNLLNFKNEKGEHLRDDQIADNIIGVLFAAQGTTASALTWILKYLHDDQNLLAAVKEEHRVIYRSNSEGKQPLTYAQTRNMPLTYSVILESLRLSSIISFTFREAMVDVHYDGYIIPKGWKVMPLFRNIHHNPELFTAPLNFNPSRFQVAPKANTYMPFGSGAHACPGNDLAKLEMLIMIHHLVMGFTWEAMSSQDVVQYSPFPVPHQGFPAKFWKETNTVEHECLK
ncbi:PREDICTED: abscisic acid 8'-hydroxylase 4-like [Ipomoea nil]|uniref:abscisic acid 8'-hydroxylase 4-like n=1 Tax=Ipomoea nil TaxID=35883 RepID=UPI000900BFF0|nr:PREDICTED: abscisic acid 8'-hydroxylase 4-like [Ipomoea nil]